ncbi:MAG: 6,7-dimethyl-8-ribityllumazine synthase [Candidatus Kapaibacterium sp.]
MSQPTPLYDRTPSADGLRLAVVAARWNAVIIDRLLDGVRTAWQECGGDEGTLDVFRCPGSYELPSVVQACAQSARYHAVIALGCVVRGDTYHFELVADAASHGIMRVMLDTGVPCILGVLTTENIEQAMDRSDTGMNNKGYEAVFGALDMIRVLHGIRTSQ